MASKSRHEALAGLFVLLGLATALGVVLWLGGASLFAKPHGYAFFYSDVAAGTTDLKEGNPVKVGGLTVGRIVELRFQPGQKRTLYIAQLDRTDVYLYANGASRIVAQLVGDTVLAVTATGDPNSPPADMEHPIPITGGLSEMMDSAQQILKNVEQTTANLRDEMDPNRTGSLLASVKQELDPNQTQGLMGQIKNTVGHVHTVSERIEMAATNLRDQTDPNRPDSIVASVAAAAAGVKSIVADAQPKIGQTLTDVGATAGTVRQYAEKDVKDLLAKLGQTSDQVLKISQDVAGISEKIRGIVDRSVLNVEQMVQSLVLVSDNLKATTEEVRRNPWRLLYKPEEKEYNTANILEAARAFADSADQLNLAITRIKTLDTKTVSADDQKKIRDALLETFDKFTKAQKALFEQLKTQK